MDKLIDKEVEKNLNYIKEDFCDMPTNIYVEDNIVYLEYLDKDNDVKLCHLSELTDINIIEYSDEIQNQLIELRGAIQYAKSDNYWRLEKKGNKLVVPLSCDTMDDIIICTEDELSNNSGNNYDTTNLFIKSLDSTKIYTRTKKDSEYYYDYVSELIEDAYDKNNKKYEEKNWNDLLNSNIILNAYYSLLGSLLASTIGVTIGYTILGHFIVIPLSLILIFVNMFGGIYILNILLNITNNIILNKYSKKLFILISKFTDDITYKKYNLN